MHAPIPFAASEHQLLKAIQQNFIEYFRPFQTLPNAVWHEDNDTTWIVVHGAPGNHVLSVNLTDNVDAHLQALLIEHEKVTGFMRWLPTACDTPTDLANRLEQLGLKRNNQGEPVMVADLRMMPAIPKADVEIIQVSTEAELREWQHATGDGFGSGFEFAAIWGNTYLKKGLEPNNPFMHFTGYVNNKPVTSVSLLLAGGIAGIYDVSTIPAYRKRGLGRTITQHAMRIAAQRGYEIAYLRSSHEGFNVYRSLGFATQFNEVECIWEATPIDASD